MAKVNVSKLARAAGLSPTVVHGRLKMGWPLEEALSVPKHGRRVKPAPVTPTTKTVSTDKPVPQKEQTRPVQKKSPSWMPILTVVVVAALLVLALYD
jgi:hypothetical protein